MIESCRKQIHIWIIEHLEHGVRYRLIQCPFCFDRFVQSGEAVCQNIEFAWNMTSSDNDIVFQTPIEDLPDLYKVVRVSSALSVGIRDHCCVV